jgi:DnaK suppressor protein
MMTQGHDVTRKREVAMDTELTPGICAELRDQLERKRRHLKGQIASGRTTEGANDTPETDLSTEPEGDRVDVSADREAWDGEHQTLFDQADSLAEVERALGKFATGTYGMCEECGRPIPISRLRVLPEARYDMAHQDQAEAHMGDTARPRDAD